MSDKDKLYKDAIEAQSEVVLSYVGKRIMEQYAHELARIEEESKDVKVPQELHDKISKLIQNEQKKQEQAKRKRYMNKFAKVCAIVLVILISGSIMLVTNVDAFKYRFENFISNIKNDHVELLPNESEQGMQAVIPSEWHGIWYPDYLPEGYIFESAYDMANAKSLFFIDEFGNKLEFSQSPAAGTKFDLDIEGDESGQTMINNQYSGYWTMFNNEITLIWLQDDRIMQITSVLELDEIEKIAENLKYKK